MGRERDSDLDLLACVQRQDAEAVQALVDRHAWWLQDHVRAQIDTSGAPSVEQVRKCLTSVLEDGPFFQPRDQTEFRQILAVILTHRLRDSRFQTRGAQDWTQRRKQGVVSSIGSAGASSGYPDGGVTALALELCLPEDAHLLRLKHWDGLSLPQAAQVLGLSQRVCLARYNRARLRLGTKMREIVEGRLTGLPKILPLDAPADEAL